MSAAEVEPDSAESAQPVVFGYIHMTAPDEIEIVVWGKEIEQYCQAHGYHLESIVVERFQPDDKVDRPNLSHLIEVLAQQDVYGIVVPHLNHLSVDNTTLAVLRKNLRRVGSELLVVYEDQNDDTKADGA